MSRSYPGFRQISSGSSRFPTFSSYRPFSSTSIPLSLENFQSLLFQPYSCETEAKQLLTKLNDEILKHDELYYNRAEPVIEDEIYDRLMQRANEIIDVYPRLQAFFTKSEIVGSSVPQTKPTTTLYVHNFPMLSLDNTFDEQGVKKFLSDILNCCEKNHHQHSSLNFTFEPKIDGVSLSLKYLNGKLVSAGTRGDGKIGEDVTRHVSVINEIPNILPHSSTLRDNNNIEIEVRGEVYLTNKDFEELQQQGVVNGTKQFSTPRNTVAGALRSHDPHVAANRKLRFIAYGLYVRGLNNNPSWNSSSFVSCSSQSFQLSQQSQTLNLLTELGFVVPTNWLNLSIPLSDVGISSLLQQCQLFESNRSHLDYDTDGVVIKVDDVALQEQLGFRQRSPKWAIAYKFTPKSAVTKLLKIEVQVGRTGILTPVAILAPVFVGGVKIERATLHNQQEIERLRIRPGQFVRVQRSGDVIPKIVEGLPESGFNDQTFKFPTNCPVCNSPVIITASSNGEEGQAHRCSGGYRCQAQVVEKLRHFCSKGAASIKGLAGATLEFFVENDLVTYPSDLYTLQDRQNALKNRSPVATNASEILLTETKGWGSVSVNNLFSAIENSRSMDCARLIYALGIPHIGQQTAKDIATAFGDDFLEFWTYLKSQADAPVTGQTNEQEIAERIASIPGIGPVSLDSLLKFAALYVPGTEGSKPSLNPLRADVEKLIQHLKLNKSAPEESSSGKNFSLFLSGKHVVLSGKLTSMTRNEAIDLVERHGGKVDKQITAKTNLIIVPSLSGDEFMTTKVQKAIRKGIVIWTEKEWQDRLAQL